METGSDQFHTDVLYQLETANETISHLSDQVDLLHQSLYVANEYLLFCGVSIALLASLGMFLVGYLITKR